VGVNYVAELIEELRIRPCTPVVGQFPLLELQQDIHSALRGND
jgi:hypothetical protein